MYVLKWRTLKFGLKSNQTIRPFWLVISLIGISTYYILIVKDVIYIKNEILYIKIQPKLVDHSLFIPKPKPKIIPIQTEPFFTWKRYLI